MPSTPRLLLRALLVGALTLTTAASGAPGAAGTRSVTYVDERGEDPGAPDVTTVV